MTRTRTPSKRWGRVIARPSEYLIKLRHGRIVKHGAGLSVFLWPGDTCTILPTSIQRVAFVADQITAERVGVAVTGIAVFRIADPLLAFRMLDFDRGDGLAQLGEILKDMFIGAARRLVANMTVEECVSRRKESIAAELMREIAPVVSGQGRAEDVTDQGWGLVIDTIEIQDVRILSENVFAQLQAPYRAELQLRAQQAQVACDREAHLKIVEATQAKLVADRQLEQQRGEAEQQSRLGALARAERLRQAEIETQRATSETEHTLASSRAEQQARLAAQQGEQAAQLARQQAEQRAQLVAFETDAELAVARRRVEAEAHIAAQQLEIDREKGELRTALARGAREVDNLVSEARIRQDFVVRALPALARGLSESTGKVHLTQIQSSGDGKSFLAETVAQLLAVGRSAGLDLGGLGGKKEEGR